MFYRSFFVQSRQKYSVKKNLADLVTLNFEVNILFPPGAYIKVNYILEIVIGWIAIIKSLQAKEVGLSCRGDRN